MLIWQLQNQIYNFTEERFFTKNIGIGLYLNYNKNIRSIKSKRYSVSFQIRNYYKLFADFKTQDGPSFEFGLICGFSLYRAKFINEYYEFEI